MTFFQGMKLIFDGFWQLMQIPITLGEGVVFTIKQFFMFFIILAFMANLIFGKAGDK